MNAFVAVTGIMCMCMMTRSRNCAVVSFSMSEKE